MSKAEYLSDLKRRLGDLEARLRTDKKRLAGGAPRARVEAAGDLALVEKRLTETKAKLARLEAEPEGAWGDFKAEMEEDLDHLERSFNRWVEGQEKP